MQLVFILIDLSLMPVEDQSLLPQCDILVIHIHIIYVYVFFFIYYYLLFTPISHFFFTLIAFSFLLVYAISSHIIVNCFIIFFPSFLVFVLQQFLYYSHVCHYFFLNSPIFQFSPTGQSHTWFFSTQWHSFSFQCSLHSPKLSLFSGARSSIPLTVLAVILFSEVYFLSFMVVNSVFFFLFTYISFSPQLLYVNLTYSI